MNCDKVDKCGYVCGLRKQAQDLKKTIDAQTEVLKLIAAPLRAKKRILVWDPQHIIFN